MGRVFKSLKPYVSKSVGAFRFNFYYKEGKLNQCFLRISNEDGLFELKIPGNTETYGYLLTAAMQNRDDQLQGYAVLVSVPVLALTQNQQLADDIGKAINAYMARGMEKGAEQAKQVTDADEAGSQALMTEIAEEISNK